MRRLFLFLLLGSLAACTLSLPARLADRLADRGGQPAPAAQAASDEPAQAASTPGSLAPDAIEVTPLARSATALPSGQAPAPSPAGTRPAAASPGAAPPPQAPPPLRPKPRRETQAAPASAPPTAPQQPEKAQPRPSPEQSACAAKGGIWSATGASSLRSCLHPTRDAGKSCRKQGDCDGLCLARSRTCAPVKPLFGCNPILQQDGTEATLCID